MTSFAAAVFVLVAIWAGRGLGAAIRFAFMVAVTALVAILWWTGPR